MATTTKKKHAIISKLFTNSSGLFISNNNNTTKHGKIFRKKKVNCIYYIKRYITQQIATKLFTSCNLYKRSVKLVPEYHTMFIYTKKQ